MQSISTATPLNDLLTVGRQAIEKRALGELQARLDRYKAGIEVLRAALTAVQEAKARPRLEQPEGF